MTNIHERIGWFNCANLNCRRELGTDHVTLITTGHMRRFCCVECIGNGLEAWRAHLSGTLAASGDDDLDGEYEQWMRHVYDAVPGEPPAVLDPGAAGEVRSTIKNAMDAAMARLATPLRGDRMSDRDLLLCPVCGCEYTHAADAVERYDSRPGEHRWSWRIPMSCEEGCDFTLIVEQHKGWTCLFTAPPGWTAPSRSPEKSLQGSAAPADPFSAITNLADLDPPEEEMPDDVS